MYKVEDGKEIPERPSFGPDAKYPFKVLKPGNSFFVPLDGEDSRAIQGRLRTSAKWAYGKAGEVTMRTVEEDGVAGVRVWRIDPEAD